MKWIGVLLVTSTASLFCISIRMYKMPSSLVYDASTPESCDETPGQVPIDSYSKDNKF
jgi:hypothetical protein